jgi:hypothetical protein
MNRLRSSISPVASSDVALHADAADEESGFSSVVRLGAHGPDSLCAHWLVMPFCLEAQGLLVCIAIAG